MLNSRPSPSYLLVSCLLLAFGPGPITAAVSQGFRVPDGFEVSLFAGDELAHDIHSMTTDHYGRIVVGGKGWVKILHDEDGDGKAERATIFTPFPRSGAQGLHFDEDGLVVSGDQGVRRWRDLDGDGLADGESELLIRTERDGEHTAHAIIKGPDGWLYFLAGNNTGISDAHLTLPSSPVKQVLTGALLRFQPGGGSEVLAHGFRNPYDFDFHPLGHLLTYDSDGERDHHLPWWTGTRIFDVGIGAEHGWVLRGSHAWSMPESWFDNTPRLWTVGRGSPAGVLVYRHRAFPARYRDGVFTACWTMGRIDFSPLSRSGSTFRAPHLETFMEAIGDRGFAPVDLVVGPTGDLFVAIGGRGTVGGVYRVRHTGTEAPGAEPREPLRQVLGADQPLASWSRAKWVPQARGLGAAAFEAAASSPELSSAERIRAIEVLVEIFEGLRPEVVERLAGEQDGDIVARVAWALSRSRHIPDTQPRLARLTQRDDPRIARAAWEALQSLPVAVATAGSVRAPTSATPDWYRGFDSDDARVRSAVVLTARRSSLATNGLPALPPNATARQRLGRMKVLGPDEREPRALEAYLDTCVELLTGPSGPDAKADALRLLQIALGDARPSQDNPDTHDGMVAGQPEKIPPVLRVKVAEQLTSIFPTRKAETDRELARLLAMLRTAPPGLLDRLVAKVTDTSAVEDDLHYLMAIARLPGPRRTDTTTRIAHAVAGLHHKMSRGKKEPSRFWPTHVGALFSRLLAQDPAVGPALIGSPNFNLPAQALFAARLGPSEKDRAARALLAQAPRPRPASLDLPQTGWTPEFIELLTVLPDVELFPALRRAAGNPTLRDSLVLALARNPQREDRAMFITALASFQSSVVDQAARALRKISGNARADEIGLALAALRRQCQFPREIAARGSLVDLLAGWTGQALAVKEGPDLLQNYAPWFTWFARAHPAAAEQLAAGGDGNLAAWHRRLAALTWDGGAAPRGRLVFEQRLCARCHEGARIGPDLVGVTTRFSREDLFTAVLDPSRDISPAWQARKLTTKDGTVHTGLMVYDSPTAKLIQTAPDTTVRLTGDDVVTVETSPTSLMPPGLLNGLNDRELADLYAYLKTLKP